MIWQFLENEELTRVLLGEATERGTYSAISSFLSAGTAVVARRGLKEAWSKGASR